MNTTNLLLTSMVFFHHGDLIPAYEFTHYPCEIDQIYIEGLEDNNLYMVSDNLYFFNDEPIFILNPNYTNFHLLDKSTDEKVGEINIRWKTDECDNSNSLELDNDSEFTGIIAPDTITVEQNEEINILDDVYAFEEGKDISHTLQYEDVPTDIPGSFISSIQAESEKNIIEKNVNIIVEEVIEETEIGEKEDSWLLKLIVVIAVLMVVYLCAK